MKKFPISTPKIYDDFFSHRPYFWGFLPLLSEILYITYMALSLRKTSISEQKFLHDTFLYSVRTFKRIR